MNSPRPDLTTPEASGPGVAALSHPEKDSATPQTKPKKGRNRTSPSGCLRFDRDFTGIGAGRVQCSSGTRNPTEFSRRNGILTKLKERSQIEVLRAVANGDISIQELVEADRDDKLGEAAALLKLRRPLWRAAETLWPDQALTATTRRYRVSLRKLHAVSGLPESARIVDLDNRNWKAIRTQWEGSAADWNHLRRAVSALLTQTCGRTDHPFRKRVVTAIPFETEDERVPDLTPDQFWDVVGRMPDHAKLCLVVLVATGMRVSEYLRCTRANLRPATKSLRIPGKKTTKSSATVQVAERLWPFIDAGIPSPLQHRWIGVYWRRACTDAGIAGVTLHDLRHCYGQWAVNAGAPEATVQVALRHGTAAMTRRYTKQRESGVASEALAETLLRSESPAPAPPEAEPRLPPPSRPGTDS
jgi:integrase